MTEDGRPTSALPEAIAVLIAQLRRAVDEEGLSRTARLEALSAVRRAIVLRGKAGKKKDERLDRAYHDYQSGMRGLKLYRKHIPNFRKMSLWRRMAEQRRLMGNLQKRAERERKTRLTNSADELSA